MQKQELFIAFILSNFQHRESIARKSAKNKCVSTKKFLLSFKDKMFLKQTQTNSKYKP